jgi:hypothetical protein
MPISVEDPRNSRQSAFTHPGDGATQREALQLRYLSTLHEIGNNKGSVIVFPFPIEMSSLLSLTREPKSD